MSEPGLVEVDLDRIQGVAATSDEQRTAQMQANSARCRERLTPAGVVRLPAHGRKAVLICFGPSLQDTWPAAALARAQGADLFTVSAAHRFMLDRGVVPLAHMDCDPRPHKVGQIGRPHPDVEYWLASCVHPSYLDLLEGHTVKLWHAYNGKESARTLQELEPDQRMVIGGGSIGLRATSVLYYLGYRDIEIHGLDCSNRDDGQQWAGEHHGKVKPNVEVWCGGRKFVTSPAHLVYMRYFQKQRALLSDCHIELHGDGLLQHILRLPKEIAA